jgi:hypothetical protein
MLRMVRSDYCHQRPPTVIWAQAQTVDARPPERIIRPVHPSRHTFMKPPSKLVLLAALLLPGGVFLLLVPPVKMIWQAGAERLSKKPA